MIGFAVVGLGMGRNRARQVVETEGAELRVVVDLNEDLARQVGGEMGCAWWYGPRRRFGEERCGCRIGDDPEWAARVHRR